VQQHLVALAVNLELATQLADTDPPAAKALLEEVGRDVQQALDETAQLAQRIFPPLLEARGLGAALRSAAASAPISARIEVTGGAGSPPELARAVYFCVLDALEHARAGAEVTVTVRDEEGALVFEVTESAPRSEANAAGPGPELDRLRDRIEALGGALTIVGEPGGTTRVSGSLPLSR
jgi:signal transduction histidine kinase